MNLENANRIENANRKTIQNHAVDYLLQMGFFNHKLCNNNKKPCINVTYC